MDPVRCGRIDGDGLVRDKRALLIDEGVAPERVTVERDFVGEADDGFIAYTYKHGMPFISHVLVYPERRGGFRWLAILREFEREISAKGHDIYIVEVPGHRQYFKPFLRFIGVMEPYGKKDGSEFYLVRCGNVRRV